MLLSEAQMRRIEPLFPLSHGVPRVDESRLLTNVLTAVAKSSREVMWKRLSNHHRRSGWRLRQQVTKDSQAPLEFLDGTRST